MNRTPDVQLVLRDWLADDGDIAPDRILDVVAERIARQPQRARRLPGRLFMPTYARLAAAAAAIVIAGLLGWQLLPRSGGVGGQATPEPSASPSPSRTSAPTAAGIQDVPEIGGALAPGQWRFNVGTDGARPSVVADVPAGWLALEGQRGLEHGMSTNSGPAGLAILFESPAHGMFSDPCHWDLDGSGRGNQEGDVAIGSTVGELIAALRANTSFTASTPIGIELGGASGEQLELRFPADLDPETCERDPTDEGSTYRVFPDTIYAQGKANIWRMFVLQVGAEITNRLVVNIEYFPGTAPDKVAEAQTIVESMEFTP
jgi:hypothetical protein